MPWLASVFIRINQNYHEVTKSFLNSKRHVGDYYDGRSG